MASPTVEAKAALKAFADADVAEANAEAMAKIMVEGFAKAAAEAIVSASETKL